MGKKKQITKNIKTTIECKIKPGKFYIIQYDFNVMTIHGIKYVGEVITYDDMYISDDYITFINSLYGLGAFKEVVMNSD